MPVGGVVRAGKIWEEWFVLVGVVGAGSPAGGADDHHVPPGLGGGGPGVEDEVWNHRVRPPVPTWCGAPWPRGPRGPGSRCG